MILFVGCGIVFFMHFLTSNEKTELIIWRAERETLPIKQRLLHELSIARLIKLDRLRRRKHLEYLWDEAKIKGGFGPVRIVCGKRKDGEITYIKFSDNGDCVGGRWHTCEGEKVRQEMRDAFRIEMSERHAEGKLRLSR